MKLPMESSPLRQAALTLHALPEADCTWLLESLPAEDMAVLRPLLAELEALGIPRDPALLDPLFERRAPPAASGAFAWPNRLDPAAVPVLERVLSREPVAVTRTLLSMHAWAWAPELLACMEQRRREQVQQRAVTCAPSPRLQAAILAALQAGMAGEAPPPAPKRSRWRTALARVGRRK